MKLGQFETTADGAIRNVFTSALGVQSGTIAHEDLIEFVRALHAAHDRGEVVAIGPKDQHLKLPDGRVFLEFVGPKGSAFPWACVQENESLRGLVESLRVELAAAVDAKEKSERIAHNQVALEHERAALAEERRERIELARERDRAVDGETAARMRVAELELELRMQKSLANLKAVIDQTPDGKERTAAARFAKLVADELRHKPFRLEVAEGLYRAGPEGQPVPVNPPSAGNTWSSLR